jgi:hypothetical protein
MSIGGVQANYMCSLTSENKESKRMLDVSVSYKIINAWNEGTRLIQ